MTLAEKIAEAFFGNNPSKAAAAAATVQRVLDEDAKRHAAAYEALEFYARPSTYHAVAITHDEPAGPFVDDFDKVDSYGTILYRPGKRARAVLSARGGDS